MSKEPKKTVRIILTCKVRTRLNTLAATKAAQGMFTTLKIANSYIQHSEIEKAGFKYTPAIKPLKTFVTAKAAMAFKKRGKETHNTARFLKSFEFFIIFAVAFPEDADLIETRLRMALDPESDYLCTASDFTFDIRREGQFVEQKI